MSASTPGSAGSEPASGGRYLRANGSCRPRLAMRSSWISLPNESAGVPVLVTVRWFPCARRGALVPRGGRPPAGADDPDGTGTRYADDGDPNRDRGKRTRGRSDTSTAASSVGLAAGHPMRVVLLSSAFEVVVTMAAPVMSSPSPHGVGASSDGGAALCSGAAAMMRRRRATFGCSQPSGVLARLLTTPMFFLGAMFLALWVLPFHPRHAWTDDCRAAVVEPPSVRLVTGPAESTRFLRPQPVRAADEGHCISPSQGRRLKQFIGRQDVNGWDRSSHPANVGMVPEAPDPSGSLRGSGRVSRWSRCLRRPSAHSRATRDLASR